MCDLLRLRETGGGSPRGRGPRCQARLGHATLRSLYRSDRRRLVLQTGSALRGASLLAFQGGKIFYPCSAAGGEGGQGVYRRANGRLTELRCLSASKPPSASDSVGPFPKLYALAYDPLIKHLETWEEPLPPGICLLSSSAAHKGSLFLLKKDNCLYRHDVNSGELLQKVS